MEEMEGKATGRERKERTEKEKKWKWEEMPWIEEDDNREMKN